MILKHPVSVSIIAGVITFFAYDFMNKTQKKKKKRRHTEKKNKKELERKIIISLIVMLFVWFAMSCYTTNPDKLNDINKISDVLDNITNNGNISTNNTLAQSGGHQTIPSKTYNILGTGINIPQNGIVIPDVLIDYV